MKKISIAIFAYLICTLGMQVHGQVVTDNTYGKGITNVIAKDSSYSMKFNMRFQTLYTSETVLDDDTENNNWDDKLLIRRSRLKFSGFAFDPALQYKIELGLSNRDHGGDNPQVNNTSSLILDAFFKWNFYKNWTVWFGQTKLPGNRERVISSQKLQFVDRSLVNSRFNIDRDIGVQLHHHFNLGKMIVREAASVSMGEGRNITVDNVGGYDYTFRLELLPFGKFAGGGDYFGSDLKREETPKLALGVTYDRNNGASKERGQLGKFLDVKRDLSTIFADMMFKYRGLSVMGEYANKQLGEKWGVLSVNPFFTGNGITFQSGYLFKNNFEVAGRYTLVDPEDNTGRSDVTQYTLGISRYIKGHYLKVQSDVTLEQEEGSDEDGLIYRFQVEVAF